MVGIRSTGIPGPITSGVGAGHVAAERVVVGNISEGKSGVAPGFGPPLRKRPSQAAVHGEICQFILGRFEVVVKTRIWW